jgi:predicted kinase
MVTGEPGSGKTTLARALSDVLRLPFLSRDHIRGGLLATTGLWTNELTDPAPRAAAVDALAVLVETAAGLGVSSVIEFVVTYDRIEAWRRMRAACNGIVVLTVCDGARSRADRRDRADALLHRNEVLAALGHRSVDDYLHAPARDAIRDGMQTEFELPLLRVATDDGYDPPLSDIVDWIIAQTRAEVSAD